MAPGQEGPCVAGNVKRKKTWIATSPRSAPFLAMTCSEAEDGVKRGKLRPLGHGHTHKANRAKLFVMNYQRILFLVSFARNGQARGRGRLKQPPRGAIS